MVILGTMDEKGGGKEEEKGMIRRTISDDRVYYKTLSRNIFFFLVRNRFHCPRVYTRKTERSDRGTNTERIRILSWRK